MRYLLLATALGAFPLAACHQKSVADYTYPPEFHYVSGQELRTAMDRMASDVTQLDRLLRDAKAVKPDQQRQVVGLLKDLQQTANSLQGGAQLTNHPELGQQLESFRSDVNEAVVAAEAEPPNYFLAGSVTSACLHCHATKP